MVKKIEKKIEINIDLDDLANELDGAIFDYISDNVCCDYGNEVDEINDVGYLIKQINYEDWCYILDKIQAGYTE